MTLPKPSEHAFNEAMRDRPNDESIRSEFRDFLQERGDLRGELWQLTHALTRSTDVADRPAMEARIWELLEWEIPYVGPFWTNSLGMTFSWIPPGVFMMGSPPDEPGRYEGETIHKVTLTKGFFMGIHPVTLKDTRDIMGWDNGCNENNKDHPVGNFSWIQCQNYIARMQQIDGKPYRLPTEAEWEYACRAGTSTAFHFGDTISTDQANFRGVGDDQVFRNDTTSVAWFPPNAWALRDMHGNMWEWCHDWWATYPEGDVTDPKGPDSGTLRVLRGGMWASEMKQCRSANRFGFMPDYRFGYFGLRLCFTPE